MGRNGEGKEGKGATRSGFVLVRVRGYETRGANVRRDFGLRIFH